MDEDEDNVDRDRAKSDLIAMCLNSSEGKVICIIAIIGCTLVVLCIYAQKHHWLWTYWNSVKLFIAFGFAGLWMYTVWNEDQSTFVKALCITDMIMEGLSFFITYIEDWALNWKKAGNLDKDHFLILFLQYVYPIFCFIIYSFISSQNNWSFLYNIKYF